MGRHARAAATVISLLLVLLATVDGSSDQQHEVKEEGGASLLASKLRDAKQDSEARLLAKARRGQDDDIDDGKDDKDEKDQEKGNHRPSPSPSPPPPPPPPGKTNAPTPPPATPAPTPPPSSTSPTPAPSPTLQAKTPAPSRAPIVATPPPTTDETVKQTDFFVDVETSVSGVAIGDKGKWKEIVHQAFPQVPLESVQIDSAVVTGQGGRRQVTPSTPSTKVSGTLFTNTAEEATKAKDSLSANGKIRMQNSLVRAGYPSAVVKDITVEAKTTAAIGLLPTGSSGGGTNPLIYLAALGVIPIIIVVYLIARAQSRKKAPPPNIVTNMKGELVIPLSSPPGYNPSMMPTAPEMSRDVARELAQNQMPSAPPMHSQGMPYPGMTGAIHSGSPQYMV